MITVNEALDHYRKEKEVNLVDQKRLNIAIKHLSENIGKLPLKDIDVINCRKYKDKRPVSDSTIARELGVLKAASFHARKWKLIKSDHMPTFEIPKNLPKREIWLHRDEVTTLFKYAEQSEILYLFVNLLYVTASRRAAIEQLEWSQLDFNRKIISLNTPGQKITNKRRPTVPMGTLYPILKRSYDKRVTRYVLGRNMDRYRQFMDLLEQSKLLYVEERDGRPAGKITPHILRHSRATHLLEAGMSIYNVATLLGDNPTTVEKVYAHACISTLEQELSRFS